MIKEIELDYVALYTLVPYPGTRLFDQCKINNLIINEMDENNFWNGNYFYNVNANSPIIKPFAISIENLLQWRVRLESVIRDKSMLV